MSSTAPDQQQAGQSRFKAPSNLTTSERLSTNTVGLVNLSDFRKRRAEVLEQQEREAREALRGGLNNASTPASRADTSRSVTPSESEEKQRAVKRAKKEKTKRALVSFGDDDDDDDTAEAPVAVKKKKNNNNKEKQVDEKEGKVEPGGGGEGSAADGQDGRNNNKSSVAKITANAAVGVVPRALTKAALRREAAEREALRKEFLAKQEAVKNTEIAIPFVFYDGSNTPGGIVRVRKGEFVWVFLDKSRKVGAQLGVGRDKTVNARKEWARVGVDDLLLVRGTMIIPHHYEFYFFIMNKSVGPGNVRLFNYSAETPTSTTNADSDADTPPPHNPLSVRGGVNSNMVDIRSLEGANDDPSFTKIVDRRWYERNKHIYPASIWQEFDPEKDYTSEIPRDTGGNTFFFSR